MAAFFAEIVAITFAIAKVTRLSWPWLKRIAPRVAIPNAGQAIRGLSHRICTTLESKAAEPQPE
jgi:hypothetical protein